MRKCECDWQSDLLGKHLANTRKETVDERKCWMQNAAEEYWLQDEWGTDEELGGNYGKSGGSKGKSLGKILRSSLSKRADKLSKSDLKRK